MSFLSSSPSHRYAAVELHESDSDMDEQQRDAAIQTAKGVAGTGRSGQSLVHRGASASPPESPLLSPEDNPSSPAATRKRMRKKSILDRHCHRFWKGYVLCIALAFIVSIIAVLLIVQPWSTRKRSAPLDNESVKKVPANQPLWPIPKKFSFGNDNVVLKDDFSIQLTPPTTSTPLLDKAFTRYIRILRGKLNHTSTPDSWRSPPLPQPAAGEQHSMLAKLSIEVEDPHASLAYGMDESYTLSIHAAPRPAPETTGETPSSAAAAATATLTANTQWGVLRGLDTFVQLVHPTDPSDSLQNPASEALPTLGIANIPWTIEDKPQYAHRGLMLDTSRNYYPVKDILRTLDAMAVVKLNVFHWHVLDQQYYPLVSKAFLELTQYGAEAPDRVYTPDDVAHIVQYGEERGIRVLPEFDAPGHAASWGRAFPNITVCLDAQPHQSYAAEPPAGQLNPLEPFTYKVLYTLIGEWAAQFPDNQAHTGGDEVNFNCWKTNIHLRNYIRHASRRKEYADQLVDKLRQEYDEPGLVELVRDGGGDSSSSSRTFGLGGQSGEDQLLEFFLSRLFKMYEERGKTPIVWEEMALEHDVNLPKSAIVQVWKNAANARRVIEKGHPVILSSGEYWYLDCGHGQWLIGGQGQSWCPYSSWQRMYSYSLTEGLSAEQQKQVYGGEVCMWSEQTDTHNLDPSLWPRSAAAAEILWSGSQDVEGHDRPLLHAAKRLPAIRQRLIDLGVAPAPIYPSWCAKHPEGCLV